MIAQQNARIQPVPPVRSGSKTVGLGVSEHEHTTECEEPKPVPPVRSGSRMVGLGVPNMNAQQHARNPNLCHQ